MRAFLGLKGRATNPLTPFLNAKNMVARAPRELAVLDQASRVLAEAQSIDEIKSIRDKAEAARTYVRAARLGLELQNRAAEVKLRAERKAGQFLRSLKLRGGDRRSIRHRAGLKLKELGITADQSRRWQRVSSVAEAEFELYLKTMNEQLREMTSAGLLRYARKTLNRTRFSLAGGSRTDIIPQMPRTPVQELIDELINHCRLLGSVLRPVYQEGPIELKGAERRIIGRLIGEMSGLIEQLNKTWPADKSGCN